MLDAELALAFIILQAAERPSPRMTPKQQAMVLQAAKMHYDRCISTAICFPKETV